MRSDHQYVAGIQPSFWYPALDHKGFDIQDARKWIAEQTEYMIGFNSAEDEKRASFLNSSLWHGVAGGVIVTIATVCRLID